eukprot:1913040-Amphidinium_carterae.1
MDTQRGFEEHAWSNQFLLGTVGIYFLYPNEAASYLESALRVRHMVKSLWSGCVECGYHYVFDSEGHVGAKHLKQWLQVLRLHIAGEHQGARISLDGGNLTEFLQGSPMSV